MTAKELIDILKTAEPEAKVFFGSSGLPCNIVNAVVDDYDGKKDMQVLLIG